MGEAASAAAPRAVGKHRGAESAVSTRIVGLGELLWDCYPEQRRMGGAPANVAYHASQLGAEGVVLSRVGQDEAGEALLAELRARGVDVSIVQRDAEHDTGSVAVDLRVPDSPRYAIASDVAYDHLEFAAEWSQVGSQANAICFGTLAQRGEESRASIQRLLAQSSAALRVFDVNLRHSLYTPITVRESLQLADIVKVNDSEARVVPALLEWSTEDGPDFARRLLREYAVQCVCITRGPEGCLLFSADGECEVAGRPSAAVDSVGAGDAFTAAFVLARLRDWNLARCGEFANAYAAAVAARPGAMPEVAAEVEALWAEFRSPA